MPDSQPEVDFAPPFECPCTQCRRDRRRAAMNPEEREAERERLAREYEERRREAEAALIEDQRRYEERRRMAAETARRERHERAQRIREQGRTFGVEIECHFDGYDDSDIASAMNAAGLNTRADGYNHNVSDSWKVVTDASVEEGWEIVSPPLRWDQRDQVETACQVIEDLGGFVERDCGLHVHHDISDLNATALKRLIRFWHDAQPLTDKLVSPNRCGDRAEWSAAFGSRDMGLLMGCSTVEDLQNLSCNLSRYHALNLQAMSKYGTVEIRQHQGTVDNVEILAWVAYGQAIVERAASTPGIVSTSPEAKAPADTVGDLLDMLPIKCADAKAHLKAKAAA